MPSKQLDPKPWYASKTMWLSIISATMGALEVVGSWIQGGDYSPAAVASLVLGVLVGVNRVLSKGSSDITL